MKQVEKRKQGTIFPRECEEEVEPKRECSFSLDLRALGTEKGPLRWDHMGD